MKKLIFTSLLSGLLALGAQAEVPTIGSRDKPIEVNADKLEVFQDENRAVFSGNVVAIQGDIKLKADMMNIHYKKPEEKKQAVGPSSQSIEKIEVNGNVFLSTPEETASGAEGLYDVDVNTITLNNNVVLTKGSNTLKGDHLVYNMETGKSVLTSGAATQSGSSGKHERVKALFVPEKKAEPKK